MMCGTGLILAFIFVIIIRKEYVWYTNKMNTFELKLRTITLEIPLLDEFLNFSLPLYPTPIQPITLIFFDCNKTVHFVIYISDV